MYGHYIMGRGFVRSLHHGEGFVRSLHHREGFVRSLHHGEGVCMVITSWGGGLYGHYIMGRGFASILFLYLLYFNTTVQKGAGSFVL